MEQVERVLTVIPHPGKGFVALYHLVGALRSEERQTPLVRVRGLRLSWREDGSRVGTVAVSADAHSTVPAEIGCIRPDGSLDMAKKCDSTDVVAMRNLAADPARKLRRFGFDEQACPFCGVHLAHGTLGFGLGHCLPCGELLGWPLDQAAVDRAEDDLREDIMREVEEEGREG